MEAYLSETGRVLFDVRGAAADLRAAPAVETGGRTYDLPRDAIDARRESSYVLMPFVVEGRWGYFDRWQGEVVHEPRWGFCGPFVPAGQGREAARFNAAADDALHSEQVQEDSFDPRGETYDGRWGLLDLRGEVLIEPEYQYLSALRDGRMLAKKDGRWGVVDICGKVVLPLEYDDICVFRGFGFMTRKRVEASDRFSIYHDSGLPLIEDLPAMPRRWESGFQRWYWNHYAISGSTPCDAEFEANRLYR